MKVKEESEKVGLDLNIQKTKIVASSPITSWQINGDSVCSHKIKIRLLLGRIAMTNLDSVLKSRDITLLTKVCIVKAMIFSVVTYECEGWTIKKAWVLKNWCFPAVVLEKTLESLLGQKEIKPINPKGNQPWILIGRTVAEAEAPILGPLGANNWCIRKRPWCWERLRAREGDDRGWDGCMASLTQWTWVWANSGR